MNNLRKQLKVGWIVVILFLNGCTTASFDSYFRKAYLRDRDSVDNHIMDMRYRLKDNPNNPDYLYNLGVGYYECELYDDAVIPLEKARALQPKATDIHTVLGAIYFKLHRYQEAENEGKEIVRLNPTNANGYVLLARTYFKMGYKDKYNEQLNILKKIDLDRANEVIKKETEENGHKKEYNPELSSKHNSKAADLIGSGEYLKAIDEGKKAIDYDPNNATAYYNVGLALSRLGMYHKALAFYKQSVSSNPNHANAYINIGFIYLGIDRAEDAIFVLQKAIAIDSNIPEAYADLGVAYKNLGRVKEAKEILNKALELFKIQNRENDIKRIKRLIEELE